MFGLERAGLMERRAPPSPYVSLPTGLQGSWTIFSGSIAQWGKDPVRRSNCLGSNLSSASYCTSLCKLSPLCLSFPICKTGLITSVLLRSLWRLAHWIHGKHLEQCVAQSKHKWHLGSSSTESLRRKRVFPEGRHSWCHSKKCTLVEEAAKRHRTLRTALLHGASEALCALERRELEAEGTRGWKSVHYTFCVCTYNTHTHIYIGRMCSHTCIYTKICKYTCVYGLIAGTYLHTYWQLSFP